jgi:uncharacterized protein (TIGR02246 family)
LSAMTCTAHAETTKDELAIRGIADSIVAAWNKGDGSAVAAVYSESGTLVAGDGRVTRGQEQIARYHDKLFDTMLKDTRLTVRVTSIKFLAAHIALMQTEGGILWPRESSLASHNRGIQSFVVVREAGAWRIALFQNTRVLGEQPSRS